MKIKNNLWFAVAMAVGVFAGAMIEHRRLEHAVTMRDQYIEQLQSQPGQRESDQVLFDRWRTLDICTLVIERYGVPDDIILKSDQNYFEMLKQQKK